MRQCLSLITNYHCCCSATQQLKLLYIWRYLFLSSYQQSVIQSFPTFKKYLSFLISSPSKKLKYSFSILYLYLDNSIFFFQGRYCLEFRIFFLYPRTTLFNTVSGRIRTKTDFSEVANGLEERRPWVLAGSLVPSDHVYTCRQV